MANRVFDYTEVSNLYNKMNTITGDKSDPTSIAGILDKINIDYTDVVHGVVGEDEMALFGELGQQMLLNWENTSANFPNFVENFSAWSTLVAQAAGDYSQFESQVQGIRTASPLGWASGGMQDSFITTSVYADALTEQEIADLAAVSEFHQLTGATYIDTGMVSYLKQKDFWLGVELTLDAVSIFSGFKAVKQLMPQIKAASTMVTPMADAGNANGFKTAVDGKGRTYYVYDNKAPGVKASGVSTNGHGRGLRHLMTDNGNSWQIGNGSTTNKVTQWVANTSNKAGRGWTFLSQLNEGAKYNDVAKNVLAESAKVAGLDAAKLGTQGLIAVGSGTLANASGIGSSFNDPNATGTYYTTLAAGDTVQIDDKQFTFFAQAPNGTNMVADDKGNLLYQDANGAMQKVLNASGVQATLDNTDDQTVLYAGSTNLGQTNSMTFAFYERDNNVYVEQLDANMDLLHN